MSKKKRVNLTPEQKLRAAKDSETLGIPKAAAKWDVAVGTIYECRKRAGIGRAAAAKKKPASKTTRINAALRKANGEDNKEDIKEVVGIMIDNDLNSKLIAETIDGMRGEA